MTEAELQNAIIQLAKMSGWLVTHFRPGIMRSGRWATPLQGDPGYPDLTMTRKGRLIFAELKSAKGKVSPEQEQWLSALSECTVEVYTWRPEDWLSNRIIEILK